MDTRKIGAEGEWMIIRDLFKHGCDVFKDLSGSSRVDFIALMNNRVFKIQAKTVQNAKSAIPLAFANSRGSKHFRYSSKEIDVLAVAVLNLEKVIYAHSREFGESKLGLTGRIVLPKNHQKKGIRMASEFTFENAFV